LICQNVAFRITEFNCKILPRTPINAKLSLLSILNDWDSRFPLCIVQLKGLKNKKKWRAKLVPGKIVPFLSSKVRAALKKQTAVSCIGAEDPSSSQPCQKVFEKDGSPLQKSQKMRT
jgi:hypothetical protein